MQATINDALAVIVACLVIAAVACAIIIFRPLRRRHRHRKRHSHQPKIDLFAGKDVDAATRPDA